MLNLALVLLFVFIFGLFFAFIPFCEGMIANRKEVKG